MDPFRPAAGRIAQQGRGGKRGAGHPGSRVRRGSSFAAPSGGRPAGVARRGVRNGGGCHTSVVAGHSGRAAATKNRGGTGGGSQSHRSTAHAAAPVSDLPPVNARRGGWRWGGRRKTVRHMGGGSGGPAAGASAAAVAGVGGGGRLSGEKGEPCRRRKTDAAAAASREGPCETLLASVSLCSGVPAGVARPAADKSAAADRRESRKSPSETARADAVASPATATASTAVAACATTAG